MAVSSIQLKQIGARQLNLLKEQLTPQEYEQLIDNHYETRNQKYNALDLISWDFKDFKTQYLTHHFHSYPARFIPQIPKTFIKLFTEEGDIVIDPFCGCGTAIVEAFLNGRDSIGNDFNPLACLITRTKAHLIPDAELDLLGKKILENGYSLM